MSHIIYLANSKYKTLFQANKGCFGRLVFAAATLKFAMCIEKFLFFCLNKKLHLYTRVFYF